MELLRVWRAHLLGGAAVAIAVPVLILAAAVIVGVAGGGLRGIGSLGQALTGPQLPEVDRAAATLPSGDAGDPPSAAALLASALPSALPAAAGGAAPAAGAPGAPGGPGEEPVAGVPDVTPGPPPAGPPPSGPAPTPAPTPAPPQRPLQQVGDQVRSVTDQVPVAGEPAGQVIDVLVDTADGLLP